jgi:HEAT repeat protein
MKNMKMLSVVSMVVVLSSVCSSYSQEAAKQDSVEVRGLIAKLNSDDDSVRYEALNSLSQIGAGVIPIVTEKLKNDTGYSRVYAARVLLRIEPENQVALVTLADISRNKQERREVRAVRFTSWPYLPQA